MISLKQINSKLQAICDGDVAFCRAWNLESTARHNVAFLMFESQINVLLAFLILCVCDDPNNEFPGEKKENIYTFFQNLLKCDTGSVGRL